MRLRVVLSHVKKLRQQRTVTGTQDGLIVLADEIDRLQQFMDARDEKIERLQAALKHIREMVQEDRQGNRICSLVEIEKAAESKGTG